ncbi:MAG: acyl carrier protein [Anaerolineaceae bacterium]|nr:acyl carrier protein [Anaerolineaceae bacterium]
MAVIDELTKVFEEVFDQNGLKLTPETTANDIEGWDSMSHVTMLMAVEEHFGIEFKPYEIANLVNVGALISLVEKKVTQK